MALIDETAHQQIPRCDRCEWTQGELEITSGIYFESPSGDAVFLCHTCLLQMGACCAPAGVVVLRATPTPDEGLDEIHACSEYAGGGYFRRPDASTENPSPIMRATEIRDALLGRLDKIQAAAPIGDCPYCDDDTDSHASHTRR